MATRTHAPECAKATDHRSADCTCSARYEPGALPAEQRRLTILAMRDADADARKLDEVRDELAIARAEVERLRSGLHVIASSLRMMSRSPIGGPHSQKLAEQAGRLDVLVGECE